MSPRVPIPTAGHPSQQDAIVELYEAGVQQKLIAERLNCSRGNVSRTIFYYRRKTGRYVKPLTLTQRADAIPPDQCDSAYANAMRNHLKSVAGARAALEAMRQ